jgi:hypothetical protein
MGTISYVMFWEGKRVDAMSRDELIEVVRELGNQVETLQKALTERQVTRFGYAKTVGF